MRIQNEIIERQKQAEEDPSIDPLIIHAEGGTTNGTHVIEFKKGAFFGLRSIQPRVHKFKSYFQSPCTGVVDGLPHYLMGASCPFSTVTKLELPVFRPNEYFFEHHQREGEERWQTYLRVVRDLISEVGELPKSDL